MRCCADVGRNERLYADRFAMGPLGWVDQGRADEVTPSQMQEMKAHQREYMEWMRSEMGFNSKEESNELAFRAYQLLSVVCARSGTECTIRLWDESDDVDHDYGRMIGQHVIFQGLQFTRERNYFQSSKTTKIQELVNPLAITPAASSTDNDGRNAAKELSVTGILTCCAYDKDSCRMTIALPNSMIAFLEYHLPPILVSHARKWQAGDKVSVIDATVIRHDVGFGVYHLRRGDCTDLQLYEQELPEPIDKDCHVRARALESGQLLYAGQTSDVTGTVVVSSCTRCRTTASVIEVSNENGATMELACGAVTRVQGVSGESVGAHVALEYNWQCRLPNANSVFVSLNSLAKRAAPVKEAAWSIVKQLSER